MYDLLNTNKELFQVKISDKLGNIIILSANPMTIAELKEYDNLNKKYNDWDLILERAKKVFGDKYDYLEFYPKTIVSALNLYIKDLVGNPQEESRQGS